MSQVFYHCATSASHGHEKFFHFLYPSSSTRTQTLDLRIMRWVYYNYATEAGSSFSSFSCRWHYSNPGCQDNELSMYHCAIGDGQEHEKIMHHLVSPLTSGKIWTLILGIMSQLFDHCASVIGHGYEKFFTIFFLLVQQETNLKS
jgi:hypothetical protein